MISSFYNSPSRQKRGFTLVEVMIAASLGSIILAGVLSTFLMLVRSGVRIGYYSTMESETRLAFEQLGMDTRMANDIVSSPTGVSGRVITSITLTIPNKDYNTTTSVTYGYDTSDASNKKLYSVPGTNPAATVGRKTLIDHVDQLSFFRYDNTGTLIDPALNDGTVKHIQVYVTVKRTTTGVAAATQVIRSCSFTIRNKVL